MKKGNKTLPKIPDEFEMNIEMLSSGRKRGFNIRVSIFYEIIREVVKKLICREKLQGAHFKIRKRLNK